MSDVQSDMRERGNCKDNTLKYPFSQCDSLQGIRVQVKIEQVVTATIIKIADMKYRAKPNNV